MKIYITGKITGGTGYKAKFQDAAEKLENQGHIILNPAVLPLGLEEKNYMQIALAMLEASDLVLFLPDYRESKGAMLELAWCERTGHAYTTSINEVTI